MKRATRTVVFGLLLLLTITACGQSAVTSDGSQALVTALPTNTLAPPPTATPEPAPATATPLPVATEPPVTADAATQPATPMPPPTATAEPVAAVFPPSVALVPLFSAETRITDLTHAHDGSGRLFLAEQDGRVRVVEDGQLRQQPFLDIAAQVETGGNEQGLLGITFDPDYASSGAFYVNYTAADQAGATVIARFRVSDDPNVADAASEQRLLVIDQPASNHNAGQLQFGPDGYLYIGTGDGGRAGDPWDNAENLSAYLGKMLRIAVRGEATYAIPADNPFVDRADVPNEIWAYGLRNPWRYSFDAVTGDLYIADVGQNSFEEVDFVAAGAAGGTHFGWDTTEGYACFEPATNCATADITQPIFVYGRDKGCSITGGYVYRGQQFPTLSGTYFFSDFCSGIIWGLRQNDAGEWISAELLDTNYNIASFGVDENGELYVLDLGGSVYQLVEG